MYTQTEHFRKYKSDIFPPAPRRLLVSVWLHQQKIKQCLQAQPLHFHHNYSPLERRVLLSPTNPPVCWIIPCALANGKWKITWDKLIFQLYIYFQKAAYTFANSTVQKTSKMSIIIDTVYRKAALALPNIAVQH